MRYTRSQESELYFYSKRVKHKTQMMVGAPKGSQHGSLVSSWQSECSG